VMDIAEGAKYSNVLGITVTDFSPQYKLVTVIATRTTITWGAREGRTGYLVENINGRWYLHGIYY